MPLTTTALALHAQHHLHHLHHGMHKSLTSEGEESRVAVVELVPCSPRPTHWTRVVAGGNF
jgi:hypothetical protein